MDEVVDALFEHMYKDEDPDDDEHNWFEENVAKFFDQFKASDQDKNDPPAPRRRRSTSSSTSRRRRRTSSSQSNQNYGSPLFFGK